MSIDLENMMSVWEKLEEKKNIIDEEEQLAAVKKSWYNIIYCINPSKKVQLAAVKQNGSALPYLTKDQVISLCDSEVKEFTIKEATELLNTLLQDDCRIIE